VRKIPSGCFAAAGCLPARSCCPRRRVRAAQVIRCRTLALRAFHVVCRMQPCMAEALHISTQGAGVGRNAGEWTIQVDGKKGATCKGNVVETTDECFQSTHRHMITRSRPMGAHCEQAGPLVCSVRASVMRAHIEACQSAFVRARACPYDRCARTHALSLAHACSGVRIRGRFTLRPAEGRICSSAAHVRHAYSYPVTHSLAGGSGPALVVRFIHSMRS
jgi:hypothetical protein